MMPITPTVKQLLIVNFLFFIGSQLLGDVAYQLLSLYDIESNNFQFWQPLTHMFMHAEVYNGNFSNIMHIGFNMFALYSSVFLHLLWIRSSLVAQFSQLCTHTTVARSTFAFVLINFRFTAVVKCRLHLSF